MLYKCLWSVNIACAGLLGSGSEVNNAELEELLKIAKLKADRVEKNKASEGTVFLQYTAVNNKHSFATEFQVMPGQKRKPQTTICV